MVNNELRLLKPKRICLSEGAVTIDGETFIFNGKDRMSLAEIEPLVESFRVEDSRSQSSVQSFVHVLREQKDQLWRHGFLINSEPCSR